MDNNQLAQIIRKRLNLEDQDWGVIEKNPKFQKLFENLMNGRDPNEVMFNTTGCFDTGPVCGGWGHVVVRMSAEKIQKPSQ